MIVIVDDYLTHYRLPFYNILQERTKRELTVISSRYSEKSFLNTIDEEGRLSFQHFTAPMNSVYGTKIQWSCSILDRLSPDVLILKGNVRNLALYYNITRRKITYTPILVWGQGFSQRRPFMPFKNPKDTLHLLVDKLPDRYICYTCNIRKLLSKYIREKNLYVANNTLHVEKLLSQYKDFKEIGKKVVKRKLGLHLDNYVIFTGRLMKRKKILLALKAFKRAKKDIKNTGFIIIGNGPMECDIKEKVESESINDVIMLGEKYGQEVSKYIFAADVMLMPGWAGLAVNHALSLGTPVVSQSTKLFQGMHIGHPPEAVHIKHGQTGRWSKSTSVKSLSENISKVLGDKKGYEKRCVMYASDNLRMERMVSGFRKAIKSIE